MTATATGSQAEVRDFLLPDLGEGLVEAEVVCWLVVEGDVVAVDQPVAEVETAKSVVEVPTPYAGRVVCLHAREGESVAVGMPLISVATAGGTPDPGALEGTSVAAQRDGEGAGSGRVLVGYGTSADQGPRRRRRRRSDVSAPLSGPSAPAGPAVASPLVRRLARDAGVGLREVPGTGEGGLITRADVEAAISRAAAVSVSGSGERRIPVTGFLRAASAALSRSRAEIPEATVWVDVDATALWQLRESARTPEDPGPGLLAHLAHLTVAALRAYPVLNSRLDVERQEIVQLDRVHLGIAVQGRRGLAVPAVMDAQAMSLEELDRGIRDLTARAREGHVTPGEVAAGTFTLNNYGGLGVDGSAAIINHPQVAILGFGRILDRPWVVDSEICVRKLTQMSFVFDHRICDGGTAAGFMREVADAIEHLPAIRGIDSC